MPIHSSAQALINFNELRLSLAEDLLSSGLFPSLERRDAIRLTTIICSPVGLKISDEYVQVVKAWRKLLCQNVTYDPSLVRLIAPLNVLTTTRDGGHTFIPECGPQVQALNRSFLLCWKSQFPSPMASWSDFSGRVSKSGSPTLDQSQLSVLRKELSFLRAPCSWSTLRGKNGPGAVSGGEKGPYKWFFHEIPNRLPVDFFRLNYNHLVEDAVFEKRRYGVTRALQVPKDARGPRFISAEPLAYQHAQGAVKDWLERQILGHYSEYLDPYDTSKHTSFLRERSYCTIDLKDASDMVSRRLVWSVFPRDVAEMLFAVRSTFVSVNGNLVPLRTFAPMGSFLCFDVMQCINVAACRSLTPARLSGFHWFGDDGIVSAGSFLSTLMVLQSLGLKVNTTKCCGPNSRFRESCGEEWFWDDDRRFDIRPVYLRDITKNRKAAVSALLVAQKLRAYGFGSTAEVLDQAAERCGLERPTKWRWNAQLQRLEVKTLRIAAIPPEQEELDDYPGIYRWFASKDADHSMDCWSPRTRVVEGWFEPSLENLVRPVGNYPTEVRSVDPRKNVINGKPLKEFLAGRDPSEVLCNTREEERNTSSGRDE